VIRPDSRAAALLTDLGAAAQESGWLRWVLRQVVMLADNAPGFIDEQLRNRLTALADRAQPGLQDSGISVLLAHQPAACWNRGLRSHLE
jgi:hypothetical protein